MNKLEKNKSLADEALEKADLVAMKKLLDESYSDLEKLVHALAIMADNKNCESFHTGSSIEAMRDVALAAIALAHSFVVNKLDFEENLTGKGISHD